MRIQRAGLCSGLSATMLTLSRAQPVEIGDVKQPIPRTPEARFLRDSVPKVESEPTVMVKRNATLMKGSAALGAIASTIAIGGAIDGDHGKAKLAQQAGQTPPAVIQYVAVPVLSQAAPVSGQTITVPIARQTIPMTGQNVLARKEPPTAPTSGQKPPVANQTTLASKERSATPS